jgi:chaperone modulatory protein CbpM
MRVELTGMLWFEEHAVTLPELSELCALPLTLLEELVHAGAIQPLQAEQVPVRYGAQALNAARAARRLREDFDLDSPALLLALGLLERVQVLEKEVQSLRARLPAPIRP